MEVSEHTQSNLDLSKNIFQIASAGHESGLWMHYTYGLGSISAITEFTDFSKRVHEPTIREKNVPVKVCLQAQFQQAGKFEMIILPSDVIDDADQNKFDHTKGITVDGERISKLSETFKISNPDLGINSRHNNNTEDGDSLYTISDKNGFTLNVNLYSRPQPLHPNVYFPNFRMNLDDTKPFEDQCEFGINAATEVLQFLVGPETGKFIVNPNSNKTFIELIEENVEHLKQTRTVNFKKLEENEEEASGIFAKMTTKYGQTIKELDRERIELIKDANSEPNFKGEFPYEKIAEYDFFGQPFLNESEARLYTMSLVSTLKTQGIELSEPVVRLHYAEMVETARDEKVGYDLLTANIRRKTFGKKRFKFSNINRIHS